MKKINLITKTALTLAALTLSTASQATTAPEAVFTGKLPTVLESLKSGGAMTVISDFKAAGGLDGWVVKDASSGKHVVVYTTADGEVMIAGLALNKEGVNLSAEYAEKYIPAEDYSVAFADFTTVADKITLGSADAKAELTVAYDANCGFCKIFHKIVEPSIKAGELRVNFVPVAILGGDSPQKAAGLLGAVDKEAAFDAIINNGVVERSNDSALISKVNNNTDLMRKNGFNGTPLVLYKAVVDGEETIFVSNGVPDTAQLFKNLGISGQIDELKKDPSLARFLP